MALINCKECGKEISNQSDKCIYCGFPIKSPLSKEQKPKQKGISFGVFLAIVIGILLAIGYTGSLLQDNSKTTTKVKQNVVQPTSTPVPSKKGTENPTSEELFEGAAILGQSFAKQDGYYKGDFYIESRCTAFFTKTGGGLPASKLGRTFISGCQFGYKQYFGK